MKTKKNMEHYYPFHFVVKGNATVQFYKTTQLSLQQENFGLNTTAGVHIEWHGLPTDPSQGILKFTNNMGQVTFDIGVMVSDEQIDANGYFKFLILGNVGVSLYNTAIVAQQTGDIAGSWVIKLK